MGNNSVLESDWKTYKRILPELLERYLKEKNTETKAILEAGDIDESGKFWEIHKKCMDEARVFRACTVRFARSKLTLNLQLMHGYGVLKDKDLEKFSEELRSRILDVAKMDS
ncbi:hypothetical protein JXI42_04555 [bacterium]|nr:hypothetical protein [bacterium]